MSIFAMADLHLSSSVNKPMDIFGARWTDYMDKIKKIGLLLLLMKIQLLFPAIFLGLLIMMRLSKTSNLSILYPAKS